MARGSGAELALGRGPLHVVDVELVVAREGSAVGRAAQVNCAPQGTLRAKEEDALRAIARAVGIDTPGSHGEVTRRREHEEKQHDKIQGETDWPP